MALLIFDLDDTMYSSESLSALLSAKLADRFRSAANLPDHVDALSEIKRIKRERAVSGRPASATQIFRDHGVSRDEFFSILNEVDPSEHIKFDAILKETLESLSKEHDLVLLSNSPKARIEKTLSVLDVGHLFGRIIGADEIPESKPNEELFRNVVESAGYSLENSVSIGDDVYKEILIPKKLGMKTVLVKRWDYPEEDLMSADGIVGHINQIPELLNKIL